MMPLQHTNENGSKRPTINDTKQENNEKTNHVWPRHQKHNQTKTNTKRLSLGSARSATWQRHIQHECGRGENHMNNKVLREWRSNFKRVTGALRGMGVLVEERFGPSEDFDAGIAAMEEVFLASFPKRIFTLRPGKGGGLKYSDHEGDRASLTSRVLNDHFPIIMLCCVMYLL